ncbi:MAG: lysophospholipid acyltransferase family protein [Actinomycetota bacterium]
MLASDASSDGREIGGTDAGLFLQVVEFALLGLFHLNRLLSVLLTPEMMKALFMSAGYITYYAFPPMRRRLDGKIRAAMPEAGGARDISRIGRRACCALLMPALELTMMHRHGEDYMRGLRVEGMEHLEGADAAGKGVILVAVHQGANATRIAVMSRLDKAYTPIFLHPGESPVENYYSTLALYGQELGCDRECPVFWTGQDTVRRVREHLERGKRVGIDIDVPGRCRVDFFGRTASLADGIARFALDTGAAIVPFQLLQGRRALEHVLSFRPPIAAASSGDREADIRSIMGEVAATAEDMVRDAPGQWMSWFGIPGLWGQTCDSGRGG